MMRIIIKSSAATVLAMLGCTEPKDEDTPRILPQPVAVTYEYPYCETYRYGDTISYSVKRHSQLASQALVIGDPLRGRLYVGITGEKRRCGAADWGDSERILDRDLASAWIEVTALNKRVDPVVIKTYFVDWHALHINRDGRALGFIIDTDFITLDRDYEAGTTYLVSLKIERTNGVIVEKTDWVNDAEAAQSMSFTIEDDVSDEEPLASDTGEFAEDGEHDPFAAENEGFSKGTNDLDSSEI